MAFKFSVACECHVLIEKDTDNSLQFTKVFPTKFLKLPICQSFPRHHFALYGMYVLVKPRYEYDILDITQG